MVQTERILGGSEFIAPNGLIETNKYRVGEVHKKGRVYFLKELLKPGTASVREDLRNEACWFINVGRIIANNDKTTPFRVPEVIDISPSMDWALFEHIDGKPLPESSLEQELPGPADMMEYLFSADFPRQDTNLSGWYNKRLEGLSGAYASDYFSDEDRSAIRDITEDAGLLTVLKPGLVHRDINPKKNILINQAGEKVLVDAELGTTPDKPGWDKPRYDDIAYLYHLLHCQYQDSRLARLFLTDVSQKLEYSPNFDRDTFVQEFSLSLLERTLSMMGHFVVSPKPEMEIDDIRRTIPEPYIYLVRESISALKC